ncbi:hypothetical protein WJX84_004881 [Apatococcus fuscideae]|uniref:PPM-type phosphatase domain-containing protein n=1 Tax=Apatococcus fuscideae TaxID=2026836 RepID=A0AAW1RQW5_9CHLO
MGCAFSSSAKTGDKLQDRDNLIWIAPDSKPVKTAGDECLAKPAVLTNSIREKLYINGRPLVLPPNSPLSAEEFSASLVTSYGTQSAKMEGAAYQLSYAFVTKQTTIPLATARSTKGLWARPAFANDQEQLCFGVVEGQGQDGTECARYAKDKIPKNLLQAIASGLAQPQGALNTAFEKTSGQLNNDVSDDELSGAKVIAAFVQGRNVHLAQLGDCSAVIAQKDGRSWRARAVRRSEQKATPGDSNRSQRGAAPKSATLSNGEKLVAAPALGASKRRLDAVQQSATPFANSQTQSLGAKGDDGDDDIISQPNLKMHRLCPDSPTLVLGNQGALAYLSDDEIIDVVCNGDDTQDLQHAALKLVTAAFASWVDKQGSCKSDITVLILQGSDFVEDMPGIFSDLPQGLDDL